MSFVTIERDYELEKATVSKLTMLYSFPRSGSHWTRRMLGEVLHRHYPSIDPRHGVQHVNNLGFQPTAANDPKIKQCPWQFIATHNIEDIFHGNVVYLKRNFEDVLKSTRAAEKELGKCWWGGERQRVYDLWCEFNKIGEERAGLVIHFEDTKNDPADTVRRILSFVKFPFTDEDIGAAVSAGRKANMLREQEELMKGAKWHVVREG